MYIMRTNRLRARPRRQLPRVPAGRPCPALPASGRATSVTWVMNITDVDDRIIRDLAAAGATLEELTAPHIARLPRRTWRPAHWAARRLTRATEHIPEMAALIAKLLENGHAYRTDDGSIFFRIASWPAYGTLAKLDPDSARVRRARRRRRLRQGRRRATSRCGRAPRRASRHGDAEIGEGRPGWHIECSAMSHEVPGRVVRHPHRRRGPDLPAPRERDRPVRGGDRQALRQRLAAQRPSRPDERREDGASRRQHQPAGRGLRGRLLACDAALRADRHALPRAHWSGATRRMDHARAAVERLSTAVARARGVRGGARG